MVWAYGFRAFFLILPLATVGAVIPLQVLWLDGASVGVWHGHEQVFGFLAAALSSLRVGERRPWEFCLILAMLITATALEHGRPWSPEISGISSPPAWRSLICLNRHR